MAGVPAVRCWSWRRVMSDARRSRVNRVQIAEAERRVATADRELNGLVRAPLMVQEERAPVVLAELAAAEDALRALLERARTEAPHVLAERESWWWLESSSGGGF